MNIIKRTPLCPDKRASQRALDSLVDALNKASAHVTVRLDALPGIVRKPYFAALESAGHPDAVTQNAGKPLAEHVTDFVKFIANGGATASYVNLSDTRVKAIITGCSFRFIGDIRADRVQGYLADRGRLTRSKGGLSTESRNHYLRRFKQFCGWLVKMNRTAVNPVVCLSLANAKPDLRQERRSLEVEELRWLLATTHEVP